MLLCWCFYDQVSVSLIYCYTKQHITTILTLILTPLYHFPFHYILCFHTKYPRNVLCISVPSEKVCWLFELFPLKLKCSSPLINVLFLGWVMLRAKGMFLLQSWQILMGNLYMMLVDKYFTENLLWDRSIHANKRRSQCDTPRYAYFLMESM